MKRRNLLLLALPWCSVELRWIVVLLDEALDAVDIRGVRDLRLEIYELYEGHE